MIIFCFKAIFAAIPSSLIQEPNSPLGLFKDNLHKLYTIYMKGKQASCKNNDGSELRPSLKETIILFQAVHNLCLLFMHML